LRDGAACGIPETAREYSEISPRKSGFSTWQIVMTGSRGRLPIHIQVEMKIISTAKRTLVAATLLCGVIAWAGPAFATPVQFGANYYDFVLADGISWADASTAASNSVFGGVNGHLVTITSAAENNFLVNSVANFSAYEGILALSWIGAQVSSSGIGS
jgi:hypothetical protein